MFKAVLLSLITSFAFADSYSQVHFKKILDVSMQLYSDQSIEGYLKLKVDVAGCQGRFMKRVNTSESPDKSVIYIYEIEVFQENVAGPQGGCVHTPVIGFILPPTQFEIGQKVIVRLHNAKYLGSKETTFQDIIIKKQTDGELSLDY